ncbi:MAG: hypothetical protein J7M39_12430 [Anaerolineae bacterium]|nr:hypothetical protein [Anaerolineae bacterium]
MHDIYIVDVEPGDEPASIERIKGLITETGARAVALMVTAVPNEKPLSLRLREWVRRFSLLQDGLKETAAQVGILIQALIGHGDRGRIAGDVPFQTIVGADGVACRESFCPLDRDFQAYATELITTLAQQAPAFFMIDDDFRIAYHDPAHKGCMCPLHLERFSQMLGVELTREELVTRLGAKDSGALREQWEALKEQSLCELARIIRNAIDAVDPSIPGSLCCVASEVHMAPAIAKTLAGNHRPLVRIHNAFYLENGHKGFPERVTRTQHEIAQFSADTIILTEADTCPHNRYSLSVKSHLAHVTATTLVGCQGAKYWFPKTDADDWEATAPYRAMLGRVRPFLSEVAVIRDSVAWLGPQVLGRPEEVLRKPWEEEKSLDFLSDDWGWRLFGRLGIPFTVSDGREPADARGPGVPRALCRTAPWAFSDEELHDFLSGSLLLDGEAAWHLDRRGFGEHLGVRVDSAPFACSAELLHVIPESTRERELSVSMTGGGRYHLEPTDPETRVVSSFVTGSKGSFTEVGPGLTWYQNDLGGRVAVYGLSMQAPLDWIFFNSKRKRQLLETLTWLTNGRPPVVVETDLDIYALHGKDTTVKGREYLCLLDLNPDTVEQVSLQLPGTPVKAIEHLSMAGVWEPVTFSAEGQRIRCETDAATMEPVILRLTRMIVA